MGRSNEAVEATGSISDKISAWYGPVARCNTNVGIVDTPLLAAQLVHPFESAGIAAVIAAVPGAAHNRPALRHSTAP